MTFSEEEIEAMLNSRFYIVKQDVTQKIHRLFIALENELIKAMSDGLFPASGIFESKDRGKISKGENYHFMPYVLLDCPNAFSADSVFAFRSMFHWGHEFSFTLHLQGKVLEVFREKILENVSMLQGEYFFICVNDTPWEYFFEEMNYVSLDEWMTNKQNELAMMLREKPFIKLSRKIPLTQYEMVGSYGLATFNKLMNLLK